MRPALKCSTQPVRLPGHGVAWRQLRSPRIALAAVSAALALAATPGRTLAEPGQSAPADPRITPGQVIDGWTGLPIPCRCRYQGQAYRLGDVVCMSTHLGTVLTRCELFLNNTSWMPTREPCTLSSAPSTAPATFAANLLPQH